MIHASQRADELGEDIAFAFKDYATGSVAGCTHALADFQPGGTQGVDRDRDLVLAADSTRFPGTTLYVLQNVKLADVVEGTIVGEIGDRRVRRRPPPHRFRASVPQLGREAHHAARRRSRRRTSRLRHSPSNTLSGLMSRCTMPRSCV